MGNFPSFTMSSVGLPASQMNPPGRRWDEVLGAVMAEIEHPPATLAMASKPQADGALNVSQEPGPSAKATAARILQGAAKKADPAASAIGRGSGDPCDPGFASASMPAARWSAEILRFEHLADHTVYTIVSRSDGRQDVTRQQRFSAFLALHQQIRIKLKLSAGLPAGKQVFNTRSVKEDRVIKLGRYLAEVLAAGGADLPAVQDFLGLPLEP